MYFIEFILKEFSKLNFKKCVIHVITLKFQEESNEGGFRNLRNLGSPYGAPGVLSLSHNGGVQQIKP